MNNKLGFLPKKINKLSTGQRYLLKAGVASAVAATFTGCGGGSGNNGQTGQGGIDAALSVKLGFIRDISVKEGEVVTINPTSSSPRGRALAFSYSGYMTNSSKQVAVGEVGVYTVRVTVTDGESTDFQDVRIIVYTDNVTQQALQLMRRITFGMTPTLYREVDALGAQGFIDQQLDPSSIDDTAFANRIEGLTTSTRSELRSWTLMHMLYSKRQLLEVMTWFWDNHFNTDINSIRGSSALRNAEEQIERDGNEAFRTNALGNFRQLLESSAKSTSMLLYLNSAQNRRSDSNENYSRELLELHTMGVNGGYTHLDIEAGAEIFTGWHVRNLQFFFNSNQHNSAAQTYLGVAIPSGGVTQGEQALDILAGHTSTAQFICSKLVTLLVNDTPPPALVNSCATTFQSAANDPDQITQVLRVIFNSAEFNAAANSFSKIKSPVEFATSIIRGLEGESTGVRLQTRIERMGIDLYENLLPTGWSEKGVDWMSSGLLLERMKTVEYILRLNNVNTTKFNLIDFFTSHGVTTAASIVDFLLIRLLGTYPAAARDNAITFLNGGAVFSLTDRDATVRLRQVLEIIMCYPQFQYQ